MTMRSGLLALLLAALAPTAFAADPQSLLAVYAEQAQRADPAFAGFSAARGQAFYLAKHKVADGSELSCASCHHEDPRKETYAHHDQIPCRACHVMYDKWPSGIPRMRRQILAFAPSANEGRFSSDVMVEKWFEVNCRYLLGRDCTPVEKGDLIAWLLTVR
jgi:hypothetical protein